LVPFPTRPGSFYRCRLWPPRLSTYRELLFGFCSRTVRLDRASDWLPDYQQHSCTLCVTAQTPRRGRSHHASQATRKRPISLFPASLARGRVLHLTNQAPTLPGIQSRGSCIPGAWLARMRPTNQALSRFHQSSNKLPAST
jgi:hypothetical protein